MDFIFGVVIGALGMMFIPRVIQYFWGGGSDDGPRTAVSLTMSRESGDQLRRLEAQAGISRIQVFRNALALYSFTVERRQRGDTFFVGANPIGFSDEVPDNIPEDLEGAKVPEDADIEDVEVTEERPTSWDRIR